jgi:exoribonuclease-2
MAKLVAPFVAKDTKIMGLCAEFDATYTAYNAYQNIAEKYWCLRYLQTQGLPWSGYVRVQKEGMVRVEPIPLRLLVPELQNTPRGARVEIEVISIDLLELTASVRVIHILDNPSVSLDSDLVEEAIEPILEPEIVPVVEPVPNDHHDNTSS